MNKKLLWIASAIVVLIVFHVCYGFQTLVPSNISWLMTVKHDWGTHYLGWAFYKNEPWHFPLGYTENYFYPSGTNIGLTDSIPLFAIFFKLFAPLLPKDFQYFGLWLLICHLLVAYYTILLLRRFQVRDLYIFFAVILVAANPVLIYRGMHPALCAHWMILASLYVYFLPPSTVKPVKILRYQLVLLVISALANPYICLFVLGFSFITPLRLSFYDRLISKKDFLSYILISLLALVAALYIVGIITFGNTGDMAVQSSYGIYALNLNSLYDPHGFSSFISAQKQVSPHQYEGFMYLGLGVFFLLLMLLLYAIYRWIIITDAKNPFPGKRFFGISIIPLLILLIIFSLFSITHIITFNDKVLFKIPIPGFLERIGDVFRASARFFWIVYYLILICCVLAIARLRMPAVAKISILIVGLCLQYLDLKPIFNWRHLSYGSYEMDIDTKSWNTLISGFDRVEMYPPFQTTNLENMDYQYFCYLCANQNKPINTGYVARGENSAATKAYTDTLMRTLEEGRLSPQSLYITTAPHLNKFAAAIQTGAARLNTLDNYYYLFSNDIKDPKLLSLSDRLNQENRTRLDSALKTGFKRELFNEASSVGVNNGSIKYALDRLISANKFISVSGFAFIEQTNNNKGDSVFLALESETKFYLGRAQLQLRPDVTSYFKKTYLADAGFDATVYTDNVENGRYKLGFVIRNAKGQMVYQPTDKLVRVGMPEYAEPRKTDPLSASSNMKASVEKHQARSDHFYFSGWAYLEGRSTDHTEISLVLKNATGYYLFETEPVLRKDVTAYFNSSTNIDKAGFEVRILKRSLPRGKYQVGTYIRNNAKPEEAGVMFSDIEIEN